MRHWLKMLSAAGLAIIASGAPAAAETFEDAFRDRFRELADAVRGCIATQPGQVIEVLLVGAPPNHRVLPETVRRQLNARAALVIQDVRPFTATLGEALARTAPYQDVEGARTSLRAQSAAPMLLAFEVTRPVPEAYQVDLFMFGRRQPGEGFACPYARTLHLSAGTLAPVDPVFGTDNLMTLRGAIEAAVDGAVRADVTTPLGFRLVDRLPGACAAREELPFLFEDVVFGAASRAGGGMVVPADDAGEGDVVELTVARAGETDILRMTARLTRAGATRGFMRATALVEGGALEGCVVEDAPAEAPTAAVPSGAASLSRPVLPVERSVTPAPPPADSADPDAPYAFAHAIEGPEGFVWAIAFSPDGLRLASGSVRLIGQPSQTAVRLWQADTGAPLAPPGEQANVADVAFSPDGRLLASGSRDGTVALWDGATGSLVTTLKGHSDWVRAVAFSPEGLRIASASFDGTVRLWHAITGAPLQVLTGHEGRVDDVAFSPDGLRIASASTDGTVRLWDASTGARIATLDRHTADVNAIAFSPDGQRLASGSLDRTVRLWDARNGEHVATLEGHEGEVKAVAFSPDGTRLASASTDRTARLWSATTGGALATLQGHEDWVVGLAFSPDGARLATASDDDTVRLWDVATGEPIATLAGHRRNVTAVAFSPDGRLLASASADRTIRIYVKTGP